MNKLLMCLVFIFAGFFYQVKAQEAITEVIKQGIKKVIIAVDLKIQRLQTKTIWLQNVQKVIENAMSKLKLAQISDWAKKQKDLYKDYFDELWKVKAVLGYYHRVREITQQQVALVKEYRLAWKGVKQDKHFSRNEVLYIGQVYTGIIKQSVKNLDQIGLVINSFSTQMTDAKRIEIINKAAEAIQINLNDLRSFNQQNIRLSLQRAKDLNDIAVIKGIYGIRQ